MQWQESDPVQEHLKAKCKIILKKVVQEMFCIYRGP